MASSLSDRFSAEEEEEICLRIHRIHFPMKEGATDVGCLVDDAPSGSPLLSAA